MTEVNFHFAVSIRLVVHTILRQPLHATSKFLLGTRIVYRTHGRLLDTYTPHNKTKLVIEAPKIYAGEACTNVRAIWGNCTDRPWIEVAPGEYVQVANQSIIRWCLCNSTWTHDIYACSASMNSLISSTEFAGTRLF